MWLLNFRGTGYSREHMWLSPDTDPEYWNFSFEEFGSFDLKTSVEFILSKKQAGQKISLLGYSQGTTVSFYALAEDPDFYKDRIDLFVALSPTIYF